jgi:hypothetical protein
MDDSTNGKQDPSELLASLRWREDMVIMNYDGERVWLKVCFGADGKRNGITDCCLESEPCAHHAKIAARTEN